MLTTWGAGLTVAAGTRLAHPLFTQPLALGKSPLPKGKEHSGYPHRALTHCEGFAPAAPRRAWTYVSESIWGLPLPWPLPVIALWSYYLHNKLIGGSLILERLRTPFRYGDIPVLHIYGVLAPVSRDYPLRAKVIKITYGLSRVD